MILIKRDIVPHDLMPDTTLALVATLVPLNSHKLMPPIIPLGLTTHLPMEIICRELEREIYLQHKI